MPATVISGVPENIELITGPLLIGYLLNWFLFGILILQVYMYYLSFPNDNKLIKSLVYGIFIVDCIQTVMTTHNAWHFLSKGWGNPQILSDPGWSWIAFFFAWRIWVLSKCIPLASVIVAIAIAQTLCAIYSGIKFAILNDVTKLASLFFPAIVWLGGSALCDLIITISLVTFLARASTGFRKTDRLVTRLIKITVETAMVTTTTAIAVLILYLVYKKNNLHMTPALALAKLYSNTLLATFNSRSTAFGGSTNPSGGDSSAQWSGAPTNGANEWRRPINQSGTKDNVRIVSVSETHESHVQMVMLPHQGKASVSEADEDDNVSKHTHVISPEDQHPYVHGQKDLEAQ